jgi:alkaline phosphatase
MSLKKQSRVALMTDLHYDGSARAMNRLYESIVSLNAGSIDALILMGDLVNGNTPMHAKRLLREVSAVCDVFKGRLHYMPGNHDLDFLSKAVFFNTLGRAGDPSRDDFKIGGYTFICLDGNFSPDGTEYSNGHFDWQQAQIPDEQLEWLRGRIAASLLPVVVVSHQRIDKECTHAVRNHEAVRKVLAVSDKVHAVFQGHNHVDDLINVDSIPYYTLAAHVEDAGPAVVVLDEKGVRLVRDFEPETVVD